MIFKYGSRIPRCFVCHAAWERLSTARLRRGVSIQTYVCRWCGVEVIVGATVLTARPLAKRTWHEAYTYLERAIQVVVSGSREHYSLGRLGNRAEGAYDMTERGERTT